MARKSNLVPAVFLTVLASFVPLSAFAQQSSLQTSFLTAGAAHLPSLGISADIVETEHLSYMAAVSRENKPGVTAFLPNAADLLIQQAEERFRNGKKFFESRDFDHARVEFDAAIDTMLRASAQHPTDQRLFDG